MSRGRPVSDAAGCAPPSSSTTTRTTALGELPGDDGPARPGPDDAHVRAQGPRRGAGPRRTTLPAGGRRRRAGRRRRRRPRGGGPHRAGRPRPPGDGPRATRAAASYPSAGHDRRIAVVAQQRGGAERLRELRHRRERDAPHPLERVQPPRAVAGAEAPPAARALEPEQRGPQREPVAARRGGEPRVERRGGIGRGHGRQRRRGRRGRVREGGEDRRLAPPDDARTGRSRERLQQPRLLLGRERGHRGARRVRVARRDRGGDRVVVAASRGGRRSRGTGRAAAR